MNILILAGGSGTRLWPASKKSQPKQLMSFLGKQTLLQHTYKRSLGWVSKKNIYIGTTKNYAKHIRVQLPNFPKSHLSIEPSLKERAPAIGLAALIMNHHNPHSSFMCMWSDHSIQEPAGYFKNLLIEAEKFLNSHPEKTLTIGITPTFPHTGLGYIQKGKVFKNSSLPAYHVKSFKEKPDIKLAKKFLNSKDYLWNSGYFIWKTQTLLNLYKQHLPEIYKPLMKIKPLLGTKQQDTAIKEWYQKMPKIDIERGLLEKITNQTLTISGQFSWADIGSWKVIKDITQTDKNQNVSKGLHIDHDSKNNLIYNYTNNHLIATMGVKNLIIVSTPQATLIADENHSEELKLLIEKLKADRRLTKFL